LEQAQGEAFHTNHTRSCMLTLRHCIFNLSRCFIAPKIQVTELQKELKDRGLDTKGKKEELIKRLQDSDSSVIIPENNTEGNDKFRPVSFVLDD
jgi:hypothetical protein